MTIYVQLPKELEKRFREAVAKRYGVQKGVIQQSICEALADWIRKGDAS